MEINLDMSQANMVIDDSDTSDISDVSEEQPKKRKKSPKPKKDTQHRKYQITINNPSEHGFTHENIKTILSSLKSVVYWCLCDETGDNGTHHTHLYLAFSSAVAFSRIKSLFPVAHIEPAKGTSRENRDYIRKEGKWSETEKAETNHIETFEEWGKMPIEQQGRRGDLARLVTMVSDGLSDYDIITQCPEYALDLKKIDVIRNTFLTEKYKKEFRKLEVHYIFGGTATGKTSYVMNKYGYDNVYKITDYDEHPFDEYRGQDVLLLDEFRSSFRIIKILNYLDGYPLFLPSRYSNKVACYTKVYIVSNINLLSQYRNIQDDEPETYRAFLRRIDDITYFGESGDSITVDINHTTYDIPTTNTFLEMLCKQRVKALIDEAKKLEIPVNDDLSEFTEIISENEN